MSDGAAHRAAGTRAAPGQRASRARADPLRDVGNAPELGLEGRAQSSDHAALKLWLRMLATTTQIEAEIRRRLRARFGITLARFDYLAQLYRHPGGLRMRDLSRYLMVTNGNVTGLTHELEQDGLITRQVSATDRRSSTIALTTAGRAHFKKMAAAHERWILELFAGLDDPAMQSVHERLGRLRAHLLAPNDPATAPS